MDEYDNPEDAIRAAHAHQQQHIETHRHELRRLFTELGEDQLNTLTDFLGVLATSGREAAGTAAYFHGVGKIYLETRFNICSACGVDHDKAVQEMGDKEVEGQMPLPLPHEYPPGTVRGVVPDSNYPVGIQKQAESDRNFYPDLPEHVQQFMEDAELVGMDFGPFLKVGETGRLNLPQVKMMEAYHLDDLREHQTNKLLGFVCLGCEHRYQTIEDRMLKQPDDCHGCHNKSAWG